MKMAIDQYGQTYHGLKYPGKELMGMRGCSSASKMHVDKIDGSSVHCGYVIGGHWLTLYNVTPYEKQI